MQLLEVNGEVRHIYIYIYIIRQLKVKQFLLTGVIELIVSL